MIITNTEREVDYEMARKKLVPENFIVGTDE